MSDCVENISLNAVKADGTEEEISVTLIKEHSLTVFIDDVKAFSLICTKDLLKELVIGRLMTDGRIKRLEDIIELRFDESWERADVKLVTKQDDNSCSTQLQWDKEQIFELTKIFSKGMPIHSKTQGTHSCILAKGKEVVFSCEDIGRHNTVDKAVGYALMKGIDLSQCILYISGRVPVDMMTKVIRSGIPVLVSKSVPTIDAVKLAKEYGVTLIVKAYPDQFEICN